jgi:AtzE family amidohydrolase
MNTDPRAPDATGATIARAVRERRASACDVLEAALARIDALDSPLNAFTARCTERALARAANVDAEVAAGRDPGPLAGVPFAVKAQIAVAGLITTAGSKLRAADPPAARDAVVVANIERRGGICVGVTNMDEFGMGGTTENRHFGPTRNPRDLSRTPGGSSGGSAAAVSGGLVPIALGSDALGSVRLPASLCGIYGLRPTRGSASGEGLLPPPGSISTIGPMARTIEDVAATFAAMTARDDPYPTRIADVTRMRIGVAGGYFARNCDAQAAIAVATVARVLRATPIEFPEAERSRASAVLVNAAESAGPQLDDLRRRADDYDPLTRDRFLAHALMPAAWYFRAQTFRRDHKAAVLHLLESHSVLLFPATPCAAPPIGTRTLRIDGVEQPTGPSLGVFTQPLAGLDCPVLTVPIASAAPLPIGVQLLAAPGNEALLFDVASLLEREGVVQSTIAHVAAPG